MISEVAALCPGRGDTGATDSSAHDGCAVCGWESSPHEQPGHGDREPGTGGAHPVSHFHQLGPAYNNVTVGFQTILLDSSPRRSHCYVTTCRYYLSGIRGLFAIPAPPLPFSSLLRSPPLLSLPHLPSHSCSLSLCSPRVPGQPLLISFCPFCPFSISTSTLSSCL